MKLIFFEDSIYANCFPLTLSRPSYMLQFGTSKIYQKWIAALNPADYSFYCRDYLADILSIETGKPINEIPDTDCIFINGCFAPDDNLINYIKNLKPDHALVNDGFLTAFRYNTESSKTSAEVLDRLLASQATKRIIDTFECTDVDSKPLKYLWDFINRNGEQITNEFNNFPKSESQSIDNSKSIHSIGNSNIYIDSAATIAPSVVLDASDGPIIIDKNVVVESFSYIQGPCYIGPDCRIVGGRIREGCSFGPVCRVGGEVEETIMQGYGNKYHEGFLGHAFLGEWVNLGALTTNSDLKNNYKNIRVMTGSGEVDSGSMKIGCFIGDHTKTGIGTMLNTGINIGFSCNLYGAALFIDKMIRSFSWGFPGSIVEYQVEKAMETAKASMARRNVEFTDKHEKMFKHLIQFTR